MSRQVALMSNDQTKVFGIATLQSDFPATPDILLWDGKVFETGPFGSGGAGDLVPGRPDITEGYIQADEVETLTKENFKPL